MNTGYLTVTLLKAGAAVATSPQAFATNYVAGTSRLGMAVTAFLFSGNVPFPATETAYVADPGTYTLPVNRICCSMSFLLGTAP